MKSLTLIFIVSVLIVSCNKSDSVTPTSKTYTDKVGAWNCGSGNNCQQLYKFDCTKGGTVSIKVDSVSIFSMARIALYAPGVTSGGVNLLTKDQSTNELMCSDASSCNNVSAEAFENYKITTSGIYTVAVTRDWSNSCDATGTFKLTVKGSIAFKEKTSNANSAAGSQCP